MNRRSVLVAGVLSLVTFVAVAVTVTEILATRVWPSLFVGIPAGVVSAVVVLALTLYALRDR
ncbi:MAG: hypothetical protein ACQETI_05640 [Halobacteriota archaeon]